MTFEQKSAVGFDDVFMKFAELEQWKWSLLWNDVNVWYNHYCNKKGCVMKYKNVKKIGSHIMSFGIESCISMGSQ